MTFKVGVGRAVALVGCGSLPPPPPPPPATWPTCLPILIVSIDVSIVSIVNIDVIMNGRGRSWQGLSHHFLSRRLTCCGGLQLCTTTTTFSGSSSITSATALSSPYVPILEHGEIHQRTYSGSSGVLDLDDLIDL